MGQERRRSFTSPFWWHPLLADVTGTRQAYEACVCRDRQGRGRIPVSTSTTIPSHSHVKSTKGDTVTCGTLSVVNPPCPSLGIGRDDANFGLFGGSCGWVVASPLGRRGPQVQAPWHHGGHGAVDVVGPVAPPGHACGCGDAGVYTDRLKRPLGAVLGHLCTLLGCGLGL